MTKPKTAAKPRKRKKAPAKTATAKPRKRKKAPAKTATRKKASGRPVKPIDDATVEGMAYAGGTTAEIADFCGVSRDTIERRFMALLIKSRASRKLRLRQLQWRAAEAGDRTMLVWLGKVELGQCETVKNEHTGADGVPLPPPAVTVRLIRPE